MQFPCLFRRATSVLALIGLLTATVACGDNGDSDTTAGGASSPAGGGEETADAETLQIGVLTALSGDYVPYGQPLHDGVRLAVEEVNNEGGLEVGGTTYRLELVDRDTRSDVNVAVAGATELLRDEGVRFVIGPATGIEASATQEITQQQDVINQSAASQLQNVLTEESAAPGGDKHHLFMVQTSDEVREGLTVQAVEDYFDDPENHAVIISNDSNGEFISAELENQLDEAGGELALDTVLYEPGTSDYSPYLTRIRAGNPDVLHIWWLPTDGINILEQAMELDVAENYFVWGIEPGDVTERLGGDVSNVVIACAPLCQGITTTDASAEFWSKYARLLGSDTEFGAAAGSAVWYYDGAQMLFQAMQDAGTVEDTDAIATALADVEYEGALGQLSYNDRHIVLHGIDFCHFTGAGEPTCEYRTLDEEG